MEARADFAAIYFMRVTSFSALSLPPAAPYLPQRVGIVSFDSDHSPLRRSYGATTSVRWYVYVDGAGKLCARSIVGPPTPAVEALLHLFRANSPLKTAYTPSPHHWIDPPNQLAFFLTCREAVLVKRLRVRLGKEGL